MVIPRLTVTHACILELMFAAVFVEEQHEWRRAHFAYVDFVIGKKVCVPALSKAVSRFIWDLPSSAGPQHMGMRNIIAEKLPFGCTVELRSDLDPMLVIFPPNTTLADYDAGSFDFLMGLESIIPPSHYAMGVKDAKFFRFRDRPKECQEHRLWGDDEWRVRKIIEEPDGYKTDFPLNRKLASAKLDG